MYFGKKVKLRAIKKEDLTLACAYLNDEYIRKLMNPGVSYPITYEEELKWFEDNSKENNGRCNFAIEDLETGTYIGGCGVNDVNWLTRVARIGIFIGDKNFLGLGYGTDALEVLIKFIFEEMNINKIKLEVFSFNERAIKCYKKCGFTVEGVLKSEIFKEGKYFDDIVMAIMRDEWDQMVKRE